MPDWLRLWRAALFFCLWLQVGIASRMVVECLHGIVTAAGVADCVGGDQQNKNENAVGHNLCSGRGPFASDVQTIHPYAQPVHTFVTNL